MTFPLFSPCRSLMPLGHVTCSQVSETLVVPNGLPWEGILV